MFRGSNSAMPRRSLPALFAPYPAALLTAAIADGAPLWCALPLFALLSMMALVVLSAITGGSR